jgi:DedD protein
MRQAYDERELEAIERSRDTEFTLGSTALLVLFFGLVLLCGACFGLGYSVGHRNGPDSPAAGGQPASGGDDSAMVASSKAKPSATATAAVTPPLAQAVVSLPGSDSTPAAGSSQPAATTAASTQGSEPAAPAQWTVKPALPAQPTQTGAPSVAGLKVAPATSPGLALMVQIAAVSHAEDADVLVAALRKRSYAVTVRRDLSDNLLHVQIGPFSNAADAEAMRQKLLNDGYNAIVEQ